MAQSNNTLIFLAKIISEKTGIPLDKVKTILSEFLVLTMNSVSAEKRVTLRGFGSFYAKRKKGRKYRDFRTGEIKFSKPGSTPAFQPGKVLLRDMKSVSPIPVSIPVKGSTKK